MNILNAKTLRLLGTALLCLSFGLAGLEILSTGKVPSAFLKIDKKKLEEHWLKVPVGKALNFRLVKTI